MPPKYGHEGQRLAPLNVPRDLSAYMDNDSIDGDEMDRYRRMVILPNLPPSNKMFIKVLPMSIPPPHYGEGGSLNPPPPAKCIPLMSTCPPPIGFDHVVIIVPFESALSPSRTSSKFRL